MKTCFRFVWANSTDFSESFFDVLDLVLATYNASCIADSARYANYSDGLKLVVGNSEVMFQRRGTGLFQIEFVDRTSDARRTCLVKSIILAMCGFGLIREIETVDCDWKRPIKLLRESVGVLFTAGVLFKALVSMNRSHESYWIKEFDISNRDSVSWDFSQNNLLFDYFPVSATSTRYLSNKELVDVISGFACSIMGWHFGDYDSLDAGYVFLECENGGVVYGVGTQGDAEFDQFKIIINEDGSFSYTTAHPDGGFSMDSYRVRYMFSRKEAKEFISAIDEVSVGKRSRVELSALGGAE